MKANEAQDGRVVLVHDGYGIVVDLFMSMPVFSKLDSHGIDVARSFISEEEARKWLADYDPKEVPRFRFVGVVPDMESGCCTPDALREAGINDEDIGELVHATTWGSPVGSC